MLPNFLMVINSFFIFAFYFCYINFLSLYIIQSKCYNENNSLFLQRFRTFHPFRMKSVGCLQ